jgi:hypothetical protein
MSATAGTTCTTPTTATTTVVVTRLDARGLRGLRGVLRQTGQVVEDCRSVPGFLGGRLAIAPHGVLWTLTVWESPAALRSFAARHAAVAAGVDVVATDSVTTAFRQAGRTVPTWAQAAQRCPLGRPRLALARSIPPSDG